MTYPYRVTVECPVCEQPQRIDYIPASGPEHAEMEPVDDPCPCYDSVLVDGDGYLERLEERCETARLDHPMAGVRGTV